MSDKPVIQIDDDWKRQAQEEKRKLAEKQAEEKSAAAKKSVAPATARKAPADPARRAIPEPSFASLVQSLMTQVLYYLGELGAEGAQAAVNLDLARHHIDTLDVLADKTKGNLTAAEQSLMDQTLYDLRSRFVAVASQMIQ